ncbi:MAG: TRAP transporter small permease [Deltaproteobacteria bacterium]|nr:TRAP transporter small permease [Deltaproteobacteria bacterium]
MTDEPEDEGSKESKAAVDEAAEAKTKKAVDKKAVDKSADGKVEEADIPPTRKHDVIEAQPSQLDLHAPLTYPDDGPVSGTVRRIDNIIGMVEQVALVTLLAIVVVTAASHALLDRFANYHVPFKDDVIRAGTFTIAMLAGAFASHQAKHLSMDLISRRFSPRARMFLKVFLALFVIFMVILFVRSGFHNIANEQQFASEDKLITRVRIAWLLPIGGFLIIIHTLLHTIIDVDYILRHKLPPERMRSGH